MTQKTRIESLTPQRAPLWIRAAYRYAKRRYGEVPEPFAVSAHHRGLLVAGAIHELAVERASPNRPPMIRSGPPSPA